MKVFAIYDSKAGAYLQPFFCPTAAVAIRSFERAANDESSDFHRWASDYTLFEIGHFDQEKGVLTGHDALLNLGLAVEFLKKDA